MHEVRAKGPKKRQRGCLSRGLRAANDFRLRLFNCSSTEITNEHANQLLALAKRGPAGMTDLAIQTVDSLPVINVRTWGWRLLRTVITRLLSRRAVWHHSHCVHPEDGDSMSPTPWSPPTKLHGVKCAVYKATLVAVQSTVVTIYTTRLMINKNSAFCLHSVFATSECIH
jgi:hypothetical protein